jgi:hypothetical protein
VTALALAAAVGLLLAEGFLPHTDDGCEVEVHCLACRLLLTTAAPRLVAAPVVVPLVAVSFRPAPDGLRLPTAPSARPAASRAPPLA